MRLLLQRVSQASVTVSGRIVAAIGTGLLVLVGFGREDPEAFDAWPAYAGMARKLLELRLFPDERGRMNVSLAESGGELLLVPQFTLYASCRKGRRPSFDRAAAPETAKALFDALVAEVERSLPGRTQTGIFGADMTVTLVNQGPVTILLDSADFPPPADHPDQVRSAGASGR